MQDTRKGGPYNKSDQESRRSEVARLHFEYGYSARKIAEMMKVSRNTINADVKFLYSSIKDELKENNEDYILKQIGRLEAQRGRITNYLQKENIEEKIRYEKLLLEIDLRINNLLSKIKINEIVQSDEIQEEKIKDFVLYLLIKHSRNPILKKEEMISEIINVFQCTMSEAENLFSQMETLGLKCCHKLNGHDFGYDLLEFVFMRKFLLSSDPFIVKIQSLFILHHQFDMQKETIKKKFKENHGAEEKWSDSVYEQFDNENKKIIEKHAEDTSKIVVDALESITDKEHREKYLYCINTFFDKEKSMLEKIINA